MITTLHIKNIGIINEITLDLNEGFNVLTGETGAGKTLIIDSLSIISGGRFSKDMIRTGETYSLVEACLFLPNVQEAEDSNVIVSREVHLNGKNLCKINGRLVTVNELKNFMKDHIDIHGQNDNQRIMEVANHIEYLDNFSDEIQNVKKEYQMLYSEYKNLNEELKQNYGDEKEKQRMLDLLEYQKNEIESANLSISEEESLEEKRKIIQNSEKISMALNTSNNILSSSTLESVDEALKALSKIESLDSMYSKKYMELQNAYYDIQEISRDLEDLNSNVFFDEYEANEVLKRIDIISGLKRKYGNNIEEILRYKAEISDKIDNIKNLEDYIDTLNLKIKEVQKIMKEKALKMNAIRKEKALVLENRINEELRSLEMKNARFKINIETIDEFNFNGLDKVEFFISTNVGEDYKPLIKIASGGEISRIMISIKSVLSEKDSVETCIFDEVDTGISGTAAKSVGVKLRKISKSHQVICVTHSAIIAAASDYHYFISKKSNDNSTSTSVILLNEQDSINEVARISSGTINDMSVKYASDLKNQFVK